MLLTVKNRLTGETQTKDTVGDVIVLDAPSDVFLDVDSSAIVSRAMRGDDLIIAMQDGTEIVINDFAVVDGSGIESKLVLSDGAIQATDIGIEATSGLLLSGGASLAAGLSGFGGAASHDTNTPDPTPDPDPAPTPDPTPDPTPHVPTDSDAPPIDLSGVVGSDGTTMFSGQLIHPVTVDGRTYYYWDRDGSGDAGSTDREKHDELDRLFNNGNDTTSTNNSFTLPDGTVLRLPELGEPDHEEGTTNGLNPAVIGPDGTHGHSEDNNPDYTGLLSIWDAHNSETDKNGVPDGWFHHNYWSASSTSSPDIILPEHAILSMTIGDTFSQNDYFYSWYVAIEVV